MTSSAMEARIEALYSAFNRRDSSFVIDQMAADVRWPRAFEGDFIEGREAVSKYWEHQWSEIDPTVEPQSISQLKDGRFAVEVHQVVRDLEGNVLADDVVQHFYEFEGDAIASMDLGVPKIDLGLS